MVRFDTTVSTIQQIRFGGFLLPPGTDQLTVCAFAQIDLAPDGNFGRIFGQDAGGLNIAFSLTTRDSLDNANKRTIQFVTTTTNGLTLLENADIQLSPNRLYHFAGVYDGSEMRLYIDGVEVLSTPQIGNIVVQNTWELLVGNRPDGERSFEGLIGDCRVYNRVLSDDEILDIKESFGDDDLQDGLLFRAPLDGAEGNTLSGTGTVLNELGGEFTATTGGTAFGDPTYEEMDIPLDDTPLSLNNVFAWHDASDSSTMSFIAANTANTWRNKLPNTRTYGDTPDGGSPQVDEVIVNGRSTLNFTATEQFTADFLNTTAGLVGKKYAIFIVERKANTGSDQWIFGGSSTTVNTNLHIGYRTSDQFSFAQWGNDINVTSTAYNAANVTRLHTLINGTTGKTVRLNGATVGSNTNTQDLTNYPNPKLTRREASGANGYAGAICEIIIFDRVIESTEVEQIEKYLQIKWGI